MSLPDVPEIERGAVLGQILRHVRVDSPDRLKLCLDSCRRAWPGAFDPGTPGLAGHALPLASTLMPCLTDRKVWFQRIRQVLERLGLALDPTCGFEPDSLAAEIVAATTTMMRRESNRWSLRQFLFDDEANEGTWRILAVDILRELQRGRPLDRFKEWDDKISKGTNSRRFYELFLNTGFPDALLSIVTNKVQELMTLDVIPWWNHAQFVEGKDDIRDAFARTIPVTPLPADAILKVKRWMQRTDSREDNGLAPLEEESSQPRISLDLKFMHLSPIGRARWSVLESLSKYARSSQESVEDSQSLIEQWYQQNLPLNVLNEEEKYRFLAHVIHGISEFDEIRANRLAVWLYRNGVVDANRIQQWIGDLNQEPENPVHPARLEFVNALHKEIRTLVREERERRVK